MITVVEYLKFAIIMILIDLIWLLGAKKLHNTTVKSIQNTDLKINPIGALGFYTFAPIGYFVFVKQIAKSSQDAFKYGCLMGFLMYMTFDFTNLAIFKNYSLSYALKDIAWGTFVYGIVSYIMHVTK